MSAYFDTSAVVKLYVAEDCSGEMEHLYDQVARVFCHEIGFVETHAALSSARRQLRIDDAAHGELVADFRSDWQDNFSAVGTTASLLERAAELADGLGLRGYDAVHLAAAEHVRLHLPATWFVSFDRQLNRAAKLLGLPLPAFVPLS